MSTQGKGMSRRNFLTGAAGVAGIAGASMLAGCSPSSTDSGSAEGEAEEEEGSSLKEATETRDVDVVICGSGAAGCMAAYEAVQQGFENILVVTKSDNSTDSNFNNLTGTCAVDTPETAEIGQDYTLVDLYEHMIDYAHWTVNAKLLHNCVMLLADDIAILEDMGMEFTLMGDRYNGGFVCAHGYATDDKGTVMESALTDMGVEFLYSMPATHVIMEDGTAVGVQCENDDGDVLNVNAKAVLVCTGGYMANEEKLAEEYGNITLCNMGSAKNTGDGEEMVLEAGGIAERPRGLGMNDIYGMNAKSTLSVFDANPFMQLAYYGGLVVNADGNRFMNEYMLAQAPMSGGGEATLHEKCYYAIFSSDVVDSMAETSYYESIGSPEVWTSGAMMFSAPLSDFDENLQTAIDEGWCYKASSIEELAETAGLSNLAETVSEYDEMVEAGEDTEFYKTSEFLWPVEDGSSEYYAFEYNPSAFNTIGGPRTDANCRALDADFNPIPGLYVAGVENGSLFCSPYYDCGGSMSGLSMASGRIAVQHMAQYVQES